jgi:hypothetical protein
MDFQSSRLNCTDGRFTTRARTFDNDVNFLDSHVLGCFDGLFSRKASREGSAFARAFKTRGTSATPTKRVSLLIGYGNDRIIE